MFKFIFVSYMLAYFVDGEPAVVEKSFVKYSNPKYLKDVQVTMYRRKSNDPYSTNMTATSFHTWGNNVSLLVSYPVEDGTTFKMGAKLCDLANKLWVLEIFRLHSNITDCPQAAGSYAFYNLAVLPRALPSPVLINKKSSTGFVNVVHYITATKEKICEIRLLLKIK